MMFMLLDITNKLYSFAMCKDFAIVTALKNIYIHLQL